MDDREHLVAAADEAGGPPLSGSEQGTPLESPEQKRTRMRSLRIAYFVAFSNAVGFSIIFTGLFPYLKQMIPGRSEGDVLRYYGVAVAMNPVAQMIFAPVMGYLANWEGCFVRVVRAATLICIAGNVVYSTITAITVDPTARLVLLMVSRFTVGASSGVIGAVRGYVSHASFVHERTAQMSMVSAAQCLGLTVGPAVQAALSLLGCHDRTTETTEAFFAFDAYTSAGWITVLLAMTSLVLTLFFQDSNIRHLLQTTGGSMEGVEESACDNEDEEGRSGQVAPRQPSSDSLMTPPDKLAICACIASFFIYFFNIVFFEAVGTPICLEQFGWNEEDTITYFGAILGVNGLLSCIYFYSVGSLSKVVDERKLLIYVGLGSAILARILILPVPGMPLPPEPRSNSSLLVEGPFEKSLPEVLYNGAPRYALIKNVPCSQVTNSTGCSLDWCSYTPAITVWQFVLCWVLAFVGHAFCVSITQSLVSKLLGTRPQGVWMGILSSAAGGARAMGPFLVSTVYEDWGTYYTFGLALLSLVLALAINLAVFKRLKVP